MYVIGVKLKYYFITIFTVTAILCLQVSNAEAISKRTVHDFTIYCQEKHALYPYCNGIVEGILYILEVNSRTESSFQICLPEDGLTLGEGVQAFTKWALKNNDYKDKPGVWGIASALIATWPCT